MVLFGWVYKISFIVLGLCTFVEYLIVLGKSLDHSKANGKDNQQLDLNLALALLY
jgi:hypothetical protein